MDYDTVTKLLWIVVVIGILAAVLYIQTELRATKVKLKRIPATEGALAYVRLRRPIEQRDTLINIAAGGSELRSWISIFVLQVMTPHARAFSAKH